MICAAVARNACLGTRVLAAALSCGYLPFCCGSLSRLLLLHRSAHRHEVESDTSEGTLADSIIELADSTRLPAPSTPNRGMDLVFRMANRLVSSWCA